MRLLGRPRRRTEPAPVVFPGVRFRISTPDGVILQVDSKHLYYSAVYAGASSRAEFCTPACRPGCDEHGWWNLITAADGRYGPQCPAEEFSTVPLKIEIKPVRLTDA